MKRLGSTLLRFHLVIGFVLLLCCAASAVWLSSRQSVLQAAAFESYEVAGLLDELQLSAQIVEIDRRGYVLNGRPSNLTRMYQERANMDRVIGRLTEVTRDDPIRQSIVQRVRAALSGWFVSRERSIALRQAGKFNAAIELVGSETTRNTTMVLRNAMKSFKQAQAELVASRRVDAERVLVLARSVLLIGLVLAFGLAALVARSRMVQMRVIQHAHDELEADVGRRQIIEARLATLADEATEANHRFAETNRMLTFAQSVANIGHWKLDHATDDMIWSDEIYQIYGVSPTTERTLAQALTFYHPDDVARVRSTIHDAIAAGTGYSLKSRIIRPDGEIVHILSKGEIDRGLDGQVTGLFGIVQDITAQAEAEARREREEARFRLIAEQASDMISLHDETGLCLFMSPSSKAVLGYDPAAMVGTTPYDFAPSEDHPILDGHRSDLITKPVGEVSTARFRMRRAGGTLAWMETAARIADYAGQARIIAVCRDVSDQVASEVELRNARLAAESAAKAKSSFLANMSHEIRTPMNGVLGFTELLLDSDLSDDQRRQAELIADSGRAMMSLLNDILDLSKVEAGQMVVREEPFDLPHLLRSCIKLVTPAVEKKGLELHLDLAPALPITVRGDCLRVRQIILNLFGNAAKFTSEGSITLRASRRSDSPDIVIEVQDTGIGIAQHRQAAVFEQFVQADSATTARFGGTGLGLAISTQLAQLLGGHMHLESELGQGSSFFLTIPLPAVASALPADTRASKPIAAPTALTGPAAFRILVAEDAEINQLLIQSMLSRLGYTTDLAPDGLMAVAMVEEARASGRPYSLVLMDMQMPNMSGIEATSHLRANGFPANVLPIIALTANAFEDDIEACLDAGMQAHLSKPVSLTNLDLALRRWTQATQIVASPRVMQISPRIRERYFARKAETLEALSAFVRTGGANDSSLAEIMDMLHKLAGTAGMFDDIDLGEEAIRLERGLTSWSPAQRTAEVTRAIKSFKLAR